VSRRITPKKNSDGDNILLGYIADIREATGIGHKPMLSEVADLIRGELDRRNQIISYLLEVYARRSGQTPHLLKAKIKELYPPVIKGSR